MTSRDDDHSETSAAPVQGVKGGHARTWTPAQRQRSRRKAAFLRALQEHGSLGAACLASGVSDVTVWRWRKQYPAFDRAVMDFVEGVREQRLVESLYRMATSDDPKMANAAAKAGEFLLKVWNRDKYMERQKIEQTVTINHQVQVIQAVREQHRTAQQAKMQLIGVRTIEG